MSFYKHHVFFCTNQRDAGHPCCNSHGATELKNYAKDRIGELGLNQEGGIRINTAGCMGRCDEAPVVVVYPEAVWYSYKDKADIDEIINEHLVKGKVVERLKI